MPLVYPHHLAMGPVGTELGVPVGGRPGIQRPGSHPAPLVPGGVSPPGRRLLCPVVSSSLLAWRPTCPCPVSPVTPPGLGSVGAAPGRAGGTHRAATAAAPAAARSLLPLLSRCPS